MNYYTFPFIFPPKVGVIHTNCRSDTEHVSISNFQILLLRICVPRSLNHIVRPLSAIIRRSCRLKSVASDSCSRVRCIRYRQ